MEKHELYRWYKYLVEDDYNYLIEYVENIKKNISNDKMIILYGPPRTGKSTLQDDIMKYLGDELCEFYPITGEIIYFENIKKLACLHGIDEVPINKINKETNNAIINLIKYKQSFITYANSIEMLDNKLLDHCILINMVHVF